MLASPPKAKRLNKLGIMRFRLGKLSPFNILRKARKLTFSTAFLFHE